MFLFNLLPIRDWFYLGAIVALLVGVGWYTSHERGVGRAQIEQQDIASKAVLDSQVKADEQIAQLAADRAAKDRQGVQKQLDDYRTAHPTGVVRLCHNTHARSTGLPQASGPGSSPANPGSGPAAVPEVSGRDFNAGLYLDDLVRAAATVDSLYRERQAMTPVSGK